MKALAIAVCIVAIVLGIASAALSKKKGWPKYWILDVGCIVLGSVGLILTILGG
jgi:hypothetical protein